MVFVLQERKQWPHYLLLMTHKCSCKYNYYEAVSRKD